MVELLIALFSLLMVSTGLFMTLKGPTVFVLAPDRITEQERQQIWLFFRNGGALYMLIGFLCLLTIFFRSNLLYAFAVLIASGYTALFSIRLAGMMKDQGR